MINTIIAGAITRNIHNNSNNNSVMYNNNNNNQKKIILGVEKGKNDFFDRERESRTVL